jgi:hypothetical protein
MESFLIIFPTSECVNVIGPAEGKVRSVHFFQQLPFIHNSFPFQRSLEGKEADQILHCIIEKF